ncbi:MAG: carboxypeptidase family protein [Hellea sp.]|nr:carboxypeptidase family protein [Hellea sp.]
MHISSAFDGGNIIVKSVASADDIRLDIRKDTNSDFFQWFYFRLTGAQGKACQMVIENASGAAFTGGWENYRACASYDRETWFRVDTAFENEKLIISHTPELDSVYYAYFAPYSMERHADLIAEVGTHPDASIKVLGETIEGQAMDCVSIGQGERIFWIIARQHPGETMAEWWMEGFLARLLDDDDPVSRVLRSKARFHIIPNMNPDGSCRGNLRTNAAGSNLNREWNKASIQSSPEVYYTIEAMNAAKPDLCLDVHGDEALPYNFIAASQGIPGYTKKQAKDLSTFLEAYETASPDFQTAIGYPISKPGKANLSMCTNWTAQEYDCLSMTLEMPFKDNANLPDNEFGWSPDRSARLGGAALDAMLAVVDQL